MSEAFVSLFPGQVLPQVPEVEVPEASAPTRKRAHRKDGTFQGDDPATSDVNEAYREP